MATIARVPPRPALDGVAITLTAHEAQELSQVLFSRASVTECVSLREAMRRADLYPPRPITENLI